MFSVSFSGRSTDRFASDPPRSSVVSLLTFSVVHAKLKSYNHSLTKEVKMISKNQTNNSWQL